MAIPLRSTPRIAANAKMEGQSPFGFPLADYLPHAVTRTWHTQIAIFWIATAGLATGLCIAPPYPAMNLASRNCA